MSHITPLSRRLHRTIAGLGAAALIAGGCSGLSDTQQRTLTGGAIGAGGGALIGALAGNAALGAGVGAAAGAAGGYLYSKHKEGEQQAYQKGVQAGAQQEKARQAKATPTPKA